MATGLRAFLKRLKRARKGPLKVLGWFVRRVVLPSRLLVWSVGARRKQARYVGKTIAITGSAGKSTASWLTAKLLSADHSVTSNGNQNRGDDMLVLLKSIAGPAEFVVFELSAYPEDVYNAALKALEIDVAVITRIGLDHAVYFRNEETVAMVKGRLVERVRAGGLACLNADDPHCRAIALRTQQRVIFYGRAEDAEVRADAVDATWPNRMSFDLVIAGVRRRVQTRLVGTLFLPSVLAALAVAYGLGIDMDAAVGRLAQIEPLPGRLSVDEVPAGHTFVRDTNKASHWSTLSLIDDLENWGPSRRIFVLGDMSDIISKSSRRYRQAVKSLSERNALVIGVGWAQSSASKLADLGNVVPAATVADVAKILEREPPSLVILKSNRTMPLDSLVEAGASA